MRAEPEHPLERTPLASSLTAASDGQSGAGDHKRKAQLFVRCSPRRRASRPVDGSWCISSMVRKTPASWARAAPPTSSKQAAEVAAPGHPSQPPPRRPRSRSEGGRHRGRARVKALSTPSARRFTPLTFFFPPSLSRALRRATASRRGSRAASRTSMCSWMKPRSPGDPREFVEKDRLAHAVQAGDQLALAAPARRAAVAGRRRSPGTSAARPASSYGRAPAPGLYGFSTWSMRGLYSCVSPL